MSTPLKKSDPCYWMLEQGRRDQSKRSTTTVHLDGCYICEDEEFSLMGMPLCYPCSKCGGNVAADDVVCSICAYYQQDDQPSSEPADTQTVSSPNVTKSHDRT